ncbi:MAG: AAA family ATPase, partial [Gemmatimonadota bacterium]|nr:AAA family ATPase [Gemmatimonadota bacterium]
MARTRTTFFCSDCGTESARWEGQCPGCREWNTLVAAPTAAPGKQGRSVPVAPRAGGAPPARLADVHGAESGRWMTGLREFDFVLGGGIVPGSVVLIGGEPGIGKSTILLQVAARLEAEGHRTLYVSGEESPHQVKLRADRLESPAGEVHLLAETELESILLGAAERSPEVLLVDS